MKLRLAIIGLWFVFGSRAVYLDKNNCRFTDLPYANETGWYYGDRVAFNIQAFSNIHIQTLLSDDVKVYLEKSDSILSLVKYQFQNVRINVNKSDGQKLRVEGTVPKVDTAGWYRIKLKQGYRTIAVSNTKINRFQEENTFVKSVFVRPVKRRCASWSGNSDERKVRSYRSG